MAWYRDHPAITRSLAVLVPLAVSALLHLVTEFVPDSAAVLILVLFVVALAATGDRLAGAVAALASTLGFDLFLTQPYLHLQIESAQDVELAVLLLIVGLSVSELASWGIRQSASADREAAFVRGALESADLAASSTSAEEGLERVAESIRQLLGVDQVTYVPGEQDPACAVVRRDGTMRYRDTVLDPATSGLPRTPEVAVIPVVHRGAQTGFFRIASAQGAHPNRDALRVAVLLAGEWSLRVLQEDRAHETGAPP